MTWQRRFPPQSKFPECVLCRLECFFLYFMVWHPDRDSSWSAQWSLSVRAAMLRDVTRGERRSSTVLYVLYCSIAESTYNIQYSTAHAASGNQRIVSSWANTFWTHATSATQSDVHLEYLPLTSKYLEESFRSSNCASVPRIVRKWPCITQRASSITQIINSGEAQKYISVFESIRFAP